MTIFEYLLVLISIIVGLGIAHILSGIGRIVSHPGRRKIYWVHLLWVGWAFLWLVFFWWFEFARSMTKVWTPTTYLFLVLYAVLLYLFCVIVLPSEAPDGADYRQYYYSRRGWIFLLLLGVIWVDGIDSWTLVDPAQRSVVAGTTDYGLEFCSMVVKDSLVATQFHPEKSGDMGLRLLANFLKMSVKEN